MKVMTQILSLATDAANYCKAPALVVRSEAAPAERQAKIWRLSKRNRWHPPPAMDELRIAVNPTTIERVHAGQFAPRRTLTRSPSKLHQPDPPAHLRPIHCNGRLAIRKVPITVPDPRG